MDSEKDYSVDVTLEFSEEEINLIKNPLFKKNAYVSTKNLILQMNYIMVLVSL